MISNFLTQGQVGSIATGHQAEARKMISERWENLGFTKGLNGYLKDNMATIFENEASLLLNEATDSSNSGSFETVVFPLVRRVFSRLLANDIVSVQAMNMPMVSPARLVSLPALVSITIEIMSNTNSASGLKSMAHVRHL